MPPVKVGTVLDVPRAQKDHDASVAAELMPIIVARIIAVAAMHKEELNDSIFLTGGVRGRSWGSSRGG